jgi:hypothetical protein
MAEPFDPRIHTQALRERLRDLAIYEKINPARLITMVEKYRSLHSSDTVSPICPDGVISRTVLQGFLNTSSDGKVFPQGGLLRDIWNTLAEHPIYGKLPPFNAPPTAAPPNDRSVEALLTEALHRFIDPGEPFDEKAGEKFSDSTIRVGKRFGGKYVMYRADLRPYKLKSAGQVQQFRASAVDIEAQPDAVHIREVQNYPATEHNSAFGLTTSGILFPCRTYHMFVMRAVEVESFRLGVIDILFSFTPAGEIGWFSGTILVASEADLFPSTPFICVKDHGNLETGLLTLEQIPVPEARYHLRDAHENAAVHYKFRLL